MSSLAFISTDLLWRNALAAIPLAILVALICRWLPCRSSTRHALWVLVLISLLAPPMLPSEHVDAMWQHVSAAVKSDLNSEPVPPAIESPVSKPMPALARRADKAPSQPPTSVIANPIQVHREPALPRIATGPIPVMNQTPAPAVSWDVITHPVCDYIPDCPDFIAKVDADIPSSVCEPATVNVCTSTVEESSAPPCVDVADQPVAQTLFATQAPLPEIV